MSHITSSANQGLLAYGISTNPDPIQASPVQGSPAMASIVITVSNNTPDSIYCNKITFRFPIGDLAQDLVSSSTGILMSANPSRKWQISMTSSGVFTATPVTPKDNIITTDGLSFQIYNIQANKKVGTFTLSAVENSSIDNKTFTNKTNNYNLTKFPYGFYVNNFAASTPMVDDGKPVTLTWSGSDLGAYTILYGTELVDVTDACTWTSPNLTAATTFSLKATVQSQGDTVDTYLYVTVIVSSPELIAKTLQVSDKIRIENGLDDLALSIGGDPALNVDAPGSPGGRFIVQSHTSKGYVGINNPSPKSMLDVKGEIKGVGILPPGSIIMHSGKGAHFVSSGEGKKGSACEGWAICNGNNGTPDLRNRFIVGAKDLPHIGDTGGEADVTLSTDQIPLHSHTIHDGQFGYLGIQIQTQSGGYTPYCISDVFGKDGTDDAGGGEPHNNMPPYYTLIYLMRLF